MKKFLIITLSSLILSSSAFAERWYERHQEARDIRQDARIEAREEKRDCYHDDDKSNRDCRRDKRDTKREGRRDARDTLFGNSSY